MWTWRRRWWRRRKPFTRSCACAASIAVFTARRTAVRLDELLDLNVLPRKGRLNRAERERESDEAFATARRQHPAVESAINALEHRGLDRVRSRGADGFARTVALSVLAANLHRLGQLLRQRERKRRRRAA